MQNMSSYSAYTPESLIKEAKTHDIISFDIFDTLAMRKMYVNKDLFRILAQRLDPVWRIDFFHRRNTGRGHAVPGDLSLY